jgi:DNA-binding PadR family transcriptional regulator
LVELVETPSLLLILSVYTDKRYMVFTMAIEMREATFAIMSALADGPRHGYGIISDIAESTEQQIRLQPGTLYAALERLRADGLVRLHSEEIVQGRVRRSFALTAAGVARLAAEAERRRTAAERTLARLKAASRREATA